MPPWPLASKAWATSALATARSLKVPAEDVTDAPLDKRPLLLIVDDDARSANLLARLLGVEGYDTEVTTDGAAALSRLTRGPVPEALITDFHLPHADGLAVGRYARSRRTSIPIFMITGDPEAVARATANEPLEDPVVVVITKPFDYGDFLLRLTAAVARARAV